MKIAIAFLLSLVMAVGSFAQKTDSGFTYIGRTETNVYLVNNDTVDREDGVVTFVFFEGHIVSEGKIDNRNYTFMLLKADCNANKVALLAVAGMENGVKIGGRNPEPKLLPVPEDHPVEAAVGLVCRTHVGQLV